VFDRGRTTRDATRGSTTREATASRTVHIARRPRLCVSRALARRGVTMNDANDPSIHPSMHRQLVEIEINEGARSFRDWIKK
tara:strand:- start:177 stop:422 length:246 start_codon:yes stop_codon:yes gene_type:complete